MMSRAKWFFLLLVAVVLAVPTLKPIPSQAVELSLGGFPSFLRTRARYISDATFLGAVNEETAAFFGFPSGDDHATFVDTRLRLTPQLVLSDAVTIRAQVDVADNYLWGGLSTNLERDIVFESVTSSDRFRGAFLAQTSNVLFAGLGIPRFNALNAVTDNTQFFNVRMLHADIVLPNNLGFVRIGRQPFDWGIGLLANGGWDPLSDLGFVLDRFLYLKSFPISAGTFTFVFVSDRLKQGTSIINGNGDGYDIGAVAFVYNQGPVTIGVYDFPYIHQTNFFAGVDLDWLNLYSGLIDVKTDFFRVVGEIQGAFGTLGDFGGGEADIEPTNIIAAVRAEVYPGFPVKLVGVEGGIAFGEEVDPASDGGDLQGGVLSFSPAYNIDNLLFKHMIPTIYGLENSVINSFYGRAWATMKLLDSVSFTPQVVVAFNQETDNPLAAPGTFASGEEVGRYLGTEVEGTLTFNIVPGVNFDLIGSLVIPGSGLEDLLEQSAANEFNRVVTGLNTDADPGNDVPFGTADPDDFNSDTIPFAVQGRLLVYIDQFFK